MNNRTLRAMAMVALGALLSVNDSRAGELVSELNGWRLQQFDSALEPSLGEPFQRTEQYRAYRMGKDAYMVFTPDPMLPAVVGSIQLTGTHAQALPFKGLQLGDSQEAVLRQLGEPSRKEAVTDMQATHWIYDDANYSVEIDRDGRLYSIRIQTSPAFFEVSEVDGVWDGFVAALDSGNPPQVLEWLRPDVEVYWRDRTLSIQRRYADFAAVPDADVMTALLSRQSGVLGQARKHAPQMDIRVSEVMGVGLAFKFPEDSLLKEVVFFPYCGEYRVFEVAFRPGQRAQR